MQSLSWNGQLSSIKLSCSKIVLNRSIKMGSHWNRKLDALSLPDWREILWPRINKFASRLANWTQQLYDNWLKCITSMYAGVCDRLPMIHQLCCWACFSNCCGNERLSQQAYSGEISNKWPPTLPKEERKNSRIAAHFIDKNLVAPLHGMLPGHWPVCPLTNEATHNLSNFSVNVHKNLKLGWQIMWYEKYAIHSLSVVKQS